VGKPKVILADTDETYLTPLELKFLDELDDIVDLEIITDKSYYESYFSSSQNADVLVVSEELYSRDLKKQNSIQNIFILTEHADEISADSPGVRRVFKYTSIKEIYSQIMAISQIETAAQKTKETIIVLVYSPSGGVGKTTLALGICSCIAQSYKKVLYVNAERISTFQHWMFNRSSILKEAYTEFSVVGDDLFNRTKYIIRTEGFDYLPPFGAALSSINIDFSIYEEFVKSAKLANEYDIIVVDTDSVFDCAKASLITQANKVILVVDQTKNAVFSMNMLMKNMRCNDSEKYLFVCNKYDESKSNALYSLEVMPGFDISEYVGHIDNACSMTIPELAGIYEIRKLSILIS